MKTMTIPKRARAINALLKQAERQNLLVRTEDGKEFVVGAIDDFSVEVAKQRRNRKLMALLDELGAVKQTVPLAEAKRRLKLS